MSLISDFPRGDPERAPVDIDPTVFKPPQAMFTRPSMVGGELLTWKPGHIFFGVNEGHVERNQDTGKKHVMGGHPIGMEDDRHICTFAGTRAGKGRSVIIPNLLHYPGSVLAIDPKGELATVTGPKRHAMKQDVRVLDPFDVTNGRLDALQLLCGFNPIEAMRKESLIEDAALIADALIVPGNGNDPHWDDSARAFIEGVILHVRTWETIDKPRSLLKVQELVGSAETHPRLELQMKDNPAVGGLVAAAAEDFFGKHEKERSSVLSNANRHLKFLNLFRENPKTRRTIEDHNFSLSDLKTKPTTVYLCLPARHIGTCNRWLRLFINLTLQEMERTRAPKTGLPGGVPVLCIMDEFAVLGHMKQIEDAAGQIAGFGVKLWPILQDMAQLQALYKDRWETFLGNSGILQFFGNSDLTTLRWISDRLGTTTIPSESRLAIQENASLQAPTIGQKQVPLMTPEEIARFFGRNDSQFRQLVIWAGNRHPFLVLQRIYYETHGLFRDAQGNPLFEARPDA